MAMRTRPLWVLFAAVSLIFAGAGCGNSAPGASSPSGLEKTTITVASLPLLDVAALHIADQQGFFRAEGLTVKIQPVAQSIAALPALKNGQLDVISGANYVTFFQAYQQGTLELKILAPASAVAPKFMRLLVMPDSPIKTLQDLAGKTVAVNILNNIQSMTFNQILADRGITAEVKYRAIQFPLMDKALSGGDVDAVLTAEPFGTVLQSKLKARMVVDAGGAPVTGLPVSGYVTSGSFIDKNPRTAAAFQRAIVKAQQLAAGDRAQVEKVLPSYAKIDAATAATLSLPGYPVTLEPERLRALSAAMVEQKLLTSDITLSDVIFQP